MDAPAVQYVRTSDGYDIAYYVAGSGETLVRTPVIWNHISRQWSEELLGPIFDALAERFRLVLYDGRGQGLSTRGLSESLSLGDYVNDLEAVVNRVEAERFILTGWAAAGVVAVQYAVDHPERVGGLVLWNYSDMHASVTAGSMIEILEQDWHHFVEITARTGFPHLEPQRVTDVLYEAMSQPDQVRQHHAIRSARGEDILRQVKVPTLFLASRSGSRPHAAEEQARRWCALLPDARLVLFDDVSGWGVQEGRAPSAVEAIERFSAGLSREQGASGLREPPKNGLSARELEVLRLLAAGRSNQQIADELFISLNTARRHVSNIFDKSGAANRVEAATYARDHGLA